MSDNDIYIVTDDDLTAKADLEDGKVPESQLPSYVDDVVEVDGVFPAEGESGKIYVDKTTDKTYRWTGTQYVMVGGDDPPVLSVNGKTGAVVLAAVDVVSSGDIVHSMLDLNAVDGDNIANLSVSTEKLTNGAVSTAKLVDGAVTASKLADSARQLVEKTWSELKAMRDDGALVPGQQYRITDYVATTNGDMGSQSANHRFDIIVTADDAGTLNEHARAIAHDGDTYFAGCDLAAWDVWYCIDNDTTRFAWALADGGKGVVYRLVDEFQNDVPCDFKGIKFKAYGDTDNVYRYTFDSGTARGNVDYSLQGLVKAVFNNKIALDRDEVSSGAYKWRLSRIVFKGEACSSNTFGPWCYNNTFNSGCIGNTFGWYCSANTFGSNCSFNTFGSTCSSNKFGSTCEHNKFGGSCYRNTFGSSCSFNTFGNDCDNNTLGVGCDYNTFGNGCGYNTFGTASATKSYVRYVRVGSGNRRLYINPTGTTSSATYYQNVEIKEGVNNATTTYKTITDANVGQTFLTTYKPANSREISV